MRRFILILATVALAVLAPAAHAAREFKIIGGKDATQAYPAQAEVTVDLGLTGELCGGTVIDPVWVLTAAHCVGDQVTGRQYAPDLFTVRLGSAQRGAGTPFGVDAVFRSPFWDSISFRGDAALLHLTAATAQAPMPVLTDATVGAASPGVAGRVVGWGYTTENGVVSDSLREVDVTIQRDTACASAYPGTIDAGLMFCAGENAGGRDACQGDSGGPLMVPLEEGSALAGIVSSGEGCGQPGKYGVYTRLASPELRAWLASMVPAVAADQAAGQEILARRAGLSQIACAVRQCEFHLVLPAGGGIVAKLRVSRAVRRALGLPSRTVAAGSRDYPAPMDRTLVLRVSRAFRHGLRDSGRRSVPARLHLSALTRGGQRTEVSRAVRLGQAQG